MTATTIIGEATFKLHKWHSSNAEVEVGTATSDEESQSYAKRQLGTRKGESKLLEMSCDKEKDEIQVSVPISTAEPTKRGIMGKVAKIYDPLGLASPVTHSGKMLYRDACDTKFAWDSPLPSDLQAKWKKWEQGLPEHVNAPRNVVKHVGKILSIDLRTEGSTPFEVIGFDFAGPVKYRIRAKTEGREVLPDLATSEFLRANVSIHQTNSGKSPKFVSLLLSYFIAQYVLIIVV